MPRRPHKKFNRPRKLFDLVTIKEEQGLIKKYGLKSRREVWKSNFEIGKMRNLAKKMITAEESEKKEFIERQSNKGFNITGIQEVLGLNKEDRLKRRLQTVASKKFGVSQKLARQLITHKHVKIGDRIINSPGHLTTIEEEAQLSLLLEMPIKKIVSDEERELLNKLHHETKPQEAKE